MSLGRFVSACGAALAVAGCAAVAIGMAHASPGDDSTAAPAVTDPATVARTWHPVSRDASDRPLALASPGTATASTSARSSSAAPAPAATSVPVATRHVQAAPTTHASVHPTTHSAPPASAAKPAPKRGVALPVAGTTAGANRVITVVAASTSSTTATLQVWDRAPGGGWLKRGGAVLAHVGSQGLAVHTSESRSATPIGSFSLTQAFGALGNPGTSLPYFRTTAADWWISQAGPLYNTHQHCAANCSFRLGDPNEHLAYETPYYNYAVVIDANTRNSATGVRAGAGSAFFLHVTDGQPTAGCVAIPQNSLVTIMNWLSPATHPRILIGVA